MKKAYRNLICLDLSREEDYPELRYSALISSGTFTFGHLGPSELVKMLTLCEPNSACFIGVNAEHFVSGGFGHAFEELQISEIISDFEIIPVRIYDDEEIPEQENSANLCIFRFIGF